MPWLAEIIIIHPPPAGHGHADFAPRNEFEIVLLRFVARDNEDVSYERACSGMGLVNCYRFVASLDGGARMPLDAATISAAAIDGSDATAGAALAAASGNRRDE